MTRLAALAAVLVGAMYLLNQLRKPSRYLGRLVLKDMSRRHTALTDWALSQISIGDQQAVLDVGCGGGRTLAKLAALAPQARVVGIDYATGSVAESCAHNAALIDAGRIQVKQAVVDRLPEPDGGFDLATAIETHYYWPDVVAACREIRRVLRPGGVLLLVAECHRDGLEGWLTYVFLLPLRAKVLSADEHRQCLLDAGFDDVRLVTEQRRGWLCALASLHS